MWRVRCDPNAGAETSVLGLSRCGSKRKKADCIFQTRDLGEISESPTSEEWRGSRLDSSFKSRAGGRSSRLGLRLEDQSIILECVT